VKGPAGTRIMSALDAGKEYASTRKTLNVDRDRKFHNIRRSIASHRVLGNPYLHFVFRKKHLTLKYCRMLRPSPLTQILGH
jgi:hypothetical protein